ncbi:MAG: hypothetical protein PHV11_06225 [Candidatus Bipolaricaulis sp.]|nr:hypothetical protein [Candidatus Bipolaricaulis sp.]MDD5220141.1 hypothetical protein [Candidatus Bipolaricaulis sp.]MDD5647131.1 hypothetical protein [Candidatus Bipolaricaulis sp.]
MRDVWVNRAPVLTLWGAVVARRLGYDEDEALTLGRAVAGRTAAAKGKRLGIYSGKTPAAAEALCEQRRALGALLVPFMGRTIPCLKTPEGLRPLDETRPADPEAVRHYLAVKFGDALVNVRESLETLAATYSPKDLERSAMDLYMTFRPSGSSGVSGWGQRGRLDLEAIDRLAASRRS